MIRRGFRKDINEKLKIIERECEYLGIEFDNTTPNSYLLITKNNMFKFTTYADVLNALALMNWGKNNDN